MSNVCEICNYATDRNLNYIRHMESKKHDNAVKYGKPEATDNIKKYYCRYCNHYFSSRAGAKRHEETDKHYKQRALRFQTENKPDATPQEKAALKIKIKHAAWEIVRINQPKKIIGRKAPQPKPIIQFNPTDYIEYLHLDVDEMKNLINRFVDHINKLNKDIEEFINYEFWKNATDDDEETTNLYIELYDLLQDSDELENIMN